MTLAAFARELRSIAGDDEALRPFVCDGSPLDCQAFVVGANPATGAPFWPHWSDEAGFDYDAWRKQYAALRITAGKNPSSKTRERLDVIKTAAAPIRVLETNAFARPTARLTTLRMQDRSAALLTFLIAAVRPSVVLAYSADAIRVIRGLANAPRSPFQLIESRHLIYVGLDEARRLGEQIKQGVQVAPR